MEFVQKNDNVQLLLVNDGSKDRTRDVLEGLSQQHKNIHSIDLEKNMGKAEAVRQGMLCAKERNAGFIAYLDADLATPPEEVLYILEMMTKDDRLVMAFGSRLKTLSNTIERKLSRHLTGRVFATFTSNSLKLPIYDTQCGCKVFKADVIDALFQEPFISPWMFDVEIFWRLIHRFGRAQISSIAKEVPLRTWIDPGESKITWGDMFKLPFEFLKIHRTYKRKK